MKTPNAPEQAPTANDSAPIWDLVIADALDVTYPEGVLVLLVADMRERDQIGRAKYGTPLQAHNGRRPLVDAYQEALDLCVYLRQAMLESEYGGAALRTQYGKALDLAVVLRDLIGDVQV